MAIATVLSRIVTETISMILIVLIVSTCANNFNHEHILAIRSINNDARINMQLIYGDICPLFPCPLLPFPPIHPQPGHRCALSLQVQRAPLHLIDPQSNSLYFTPLKFNMVHLQISHWKRRFLLETIISGSMKLFLCTG